MWFSYNNNKFDMSESFRLINNLQSQFTVCFIVIHSVRRSFTLYMVSNNSLHNVDFRWVWEGVLYLKPPPPKVFLRFLGVCNSGVFTIWKQLIYSIVNLLARKHLTFIIIFRGFLNETSNLKFTIIQWVCLNTERLIGDYNIQFLCCISKVVPLRFFLSSKFKFL